MEVSDPTPTSWPLTALIKSGTMRQTPSEKGSVEIWVTVAKGSPHTACGTVRFTWKGSSPSFQPDFRS